MVMVRGSKWVAAVVIDAGAAPDRALRAPKGWQRSSLHSARETPRKGPCVAMAMAAYSEQVGRNCSPPGERMQSRGDPAAIKSESGEQHAVMSGPLPAVLRRHCLLRGRLGFVPVEGYAQSPPQVSKFDDEYAAAGMKDQIAALGQQIHVAANGLSHAALDAVALMRLA